MLLGPFTDEILLLRQQSQLSTHTFSTSTFFSSIITIRSTELDYIYEEYFKDFFKPEIGEQSIL